MTVEEFRLSPEQRGHLIGLLEKVLSPPMREDWDNFGDFELLMSALVAAFKDGLSPDQTQALFRGQWGIDREVMMVALVTTAAQAAQVIEAVQPKSIQRN
jgi:hypothetical protein